MKNNLIVLFLIAGLNAALSQTKLLTMEEAIIKQRTTLAPAGLKQLKWIKNSDNFSYIDNKEGEEAIYIQSAASEKYLKTITLKELNDALRNVNIKTLVAFPSIEWKNNDQFIFNRENQTLNYNYTKKQITVVINDGLNEKAENTDVADKTNYVAYTLENNLFVYDGKNELIVTNDIDKNIVNGVSVHREEFGITKGTFWSPQGNLLAFYKMDQRMVTDYPVIDWIPRPAKDNLIKYPMAGDKSHEVTVGIYNVNTGKTVFIQTGEPKEQYLTNIAWSPDEQQLYIAVLNRKQNHLKLNVYNTVTGYFEKTLFEEKNEKYVHPEHPVMFVPNHPDQFIWQSERDGYNHLYLYNTEGKLLKQLTKGKWVVTHINGFDAKGKTLFYTSTAESPVTRNLYSVDLKKGMSTKLTSNEGTHVSFVNDKGNYFLDTYQSIKTPREIAVYNSKGKKMRIIKTAENPLQDYQLGELALLKLKNETGDDLYCRMYKPINFDSTKKYPAIVYLYGGPNVQLINNTWNAAGDLWFQYMAERGFFVFTLDGRGSKNRGLAFEQAVAGKLGTEEMKDQLVGIHYLKQQAYIDTNRLGIFGWSFGGFMTTSFMTRYPDIFKVAVAGGPVIDWSFYEIMYTERYMSTPQENLNGYKESNLLNYANKLKGKLMLIHGTSDDVVLWQHSLLFLKACIDAGKQVDYFVYPGHKHNVLGKDRQHLFQKITDYFIQNL